MHWKNQPTIVADAVQIPNHKPSHKQIPNHGGMRDLALEPAPPENKMLIQPAKSWKSDLSVSPTLNFRNKPDATKTTIDITAQMTRLV